MLFFKACEIVFASDVAIGIVLSRLAVNLGKRQFKDSDRKTATNGGFAVSDNCIYACSEFLSVARHVAVRNEAYRLRDFLQSVEVLVSPCRTERSNGILQSYGLKPQHVRCTLHANHEIFIPCSVRRFVDAEKHFALCEDLGGRRVYVFRFLVACDVASGEADKFPSAVAYRDSDTIAEESVKRAVVLAFLNYAEFEQSVNIDGLALAPIEERHRRIGSEADADFVAEVLAPAM